MDYQINFTDTSRSFLIKPYTANGPDTPSGTAFGTVGGVTAVSSDTSLLLVGKGVVEYGEVVQENLVHLLENFANTYPPYYPVEGQLWFKKDTNELFVCTDETAARADGSPQVAPYNGWTTISLSTLTGDLDMAGFKVINLGNPTNPSDAVNVSYLTTTLTNSAILRDGSTTPTADISFNNFKLTSLGNPVNPQDAVNLQYLNTQLSGLGGTYVNTSGDTMTGNLNITSADLNLVGPGADLNVTSGNITLTSGVLVIATGADIQFTGAGVIDMGNNKITNLQDPFNPQDAATKAYVDLVGGGGGGGADGVVYAGNINVVTGDLTLNRTLGLPDVTISNIAPFAHTHQTSSVYHDTNPTEDKSRVRQIMQGSGTWPNNTVLEVLNTIDQDLYRLSTRNQRVLIPGATYTITARTTGASGTWTIGGTDVTDLFRVGFLFEVTGNTGTGDGTYTVASSVFSAGNTVITISGTIPGGATADGIISPLTYELAIDYLAERNELFVFKNGIKQYAAPRGISSAEILIPAVLPDNTRVNEGDWCGLVNGTKSFNVAFDGNPNTPISVTVSQTVYNVLTVVNGANAVWTISGNHAIDFNKNQEIIVYNNTGLGGSNIVKYKLASATNVGINTELVVYDTVVGASNNGNINIAFTFKDLVDAIDATTNVIGTLTTKGDVSLYIGGGHCMMEDGTVVFFSHKSGIGSRAVVTDIDLWITIDTNLNTTSATTFSNDPAVTADYGFREFGDPGILVNPDATNIIELTAALTTTDVLEITKIK